jgi:hypothetical protein
VGIFAKEADGWWERLTTMCRPGEDRVEVRRPIRRVTAVTSVVGYGVLMGVLELELDAFVGIPVIVAALAAWIGSVYVVYEFRRRLANAPDAALDEREVRIRDRAYLQAHRIGSTALFVVGVAAMFVVGLDATVSVDTVVDVVFSLAMGLVALPAAVVAWTEPDDEDAYESADALAEPR